jgi:hypothetical protein
LSAKQWKTNDSSKFYETKTIIKNLKKAGKNLWTIIGQKSGAKWGAATVMLRQHFFKDYLGGRE